MYLPALITLLLTGSHVYGKAVFAHFMLENVITWTSAQWRADIALAQAAHIDAFALNIRNGQGGLSSALPIAFEVALSKGFQLFFSFDYAGGGAWAPSDVVTLIKQYGKTGAYYKHNGKPFVSTFEGPESAGDWTWIKSQTGCFFMPDWSSAGAKAALQLNPGAPDGLFSWAAWPWGNTDMNTYVDASYRQYLNETGKSLPYMMPVSPWFYTNLPGYDKNWLWRGDDLWFDRWQEVLYLQPEFVEILTWNDFGESHYIGPLHSEQYGAFDNSTGKAPFNYVENMPHDGWRMTLPYVIDMYKNGVATVSNEGLSAWYRLTPKNSASCTDGGTTGNTATQLQLELRPADIVQDKVFYSALLGSAQSVTVTVGGKNLGAKWTHTPSGGIGVYHGSVEFGGSIGPVVVTVGSMVVNGESITTSCTRTTGQNGVTNWNAWVGSATGRSVSATPSLNLSSQVCIEGSGVNNFQGLCSFACHYGYCPIGACFCTDMGPQVTLPSNESTPGWGTVGYPAQGLDANYLGLCGFDCFYGYCPSSTCGTVKYPLTTPTVSPFLPLTCTSGSGAGNLAGLCSYACNYGFCPLHSCTCNSQGPLNLPPPQTGGSGKAATGMDPFIYNDLCQFTCSRGYCPPGVCAIQGSSSAGSFLVYLPPGVFSQDSPTVACFPPCTLVLPPYTLARPTTISFPPYTTTLAEVHSTGTKVTTYITPGTTKTSTLVLYQTVIITTTILIPPVTTTEIAFWNIILTSGETTKTIALTSSILPPSMTISNPSVTRTIHPPPYPWTTSSIATTTRSGGPPPFLTWTSSVPGPQCTSGCGKRCTGLFCSPSCILCKIPDVDFPDPEDPLNPYGPRHPYSPEPEQCTTTSASDCTKGCIAGSLTASCTTSCSLTFGCSASSSATTTTRSRGPVLTQGSEYWPSATLGSAYTSSVYAAAQSALSAEFPGYTYRSGTAQATGSHSYDIYQWGCAGSQYYYHYNVGSASAGYCDSSAALIGSAPPGVGTTIWIVTGAYSGAMDFALAALPWTFLWNLQMKKQEKFGVAVAMSMGVIAGIVAIVKCTKLPNLNSPDAYKATELYMWDIAESTATMIAACIPSLRVLVVRERRNTTVRTQSPKVPYFSDGPSRGLSKKVSEDSAATETV